MVDIEYVKANIKDGWQLNPNEKVVNSIIKDKRTFVEYDSNFEIKSVKIKWLGWDSITIELCSIGLIATYKPEHGSDTKLLDLTWVLVEPFFFKQ